MALRKATAKYVLFADDDIVYKKDYVKLIETFIKKNNSSIYIFRIFSPEILINREDVLNHEIKFDENFGIGAQYTCGEETIFLSDCIKKKLKIVNSNELIGLEVKSRPSYWYRGLNEKVLESTGAAMARINKKLSVFYIIQFCVRKHKHYKKKHISFENALKVMLNGRKKWLKF